MSLVSGVIQPYPRCARRCPVAVWPQEEDEVIGVVDFGDEGGEEVIRKSEDIHAASIAGEIAESDFDFGFIN